MRTHARACSVLALLALVAFAPQDGAEVPAPAQPDPAGAAGGPGMATGEAQQDAQPQPAPEPAAEPWDGTFATGMERLATLAREEHADEALALGDRLLAPNAYQRARARLEEWSHGLSERALAPVDGALAWLGLETLDPRDRAEVRYARGLVHARQGAVLSADEELDLARAQAGPGATREDAVYALGTLDLLLGEELYAQIPEVAGATQPAPAAGAPGASGSEQPPDPLELARKAYLAAREHLVERLRLDWRDADTRANVEWVQRRLRELDEIERQRQEQQQEQQQQQQDQDQQQDQQQQDQDQQQQEQQDQDQQQQEDQQQDQSSDESQQSEDPSEDSQDEPSPDEQESDEQESDEQEGDESEAEQDESEQEAGKLEERMLTEEEMKRLLEVLQRYQEQGEEMREQLKRVRREHVERDW